MTADELPETWTRCTLEIGRAVPAGVGQGHASTATIPDLPRRKSETWWTDRLVKKAANSSARSGRVTTSSRCVWTKSDGVWIVLHSGSRGVGNELANIHIDGAKDLMRR